MAEAKRTRPDQGARSKSMAGGPDTGKVTAPAPWPARALPHDQDIGVLEPIEVLDRLRRAHFELQRFLGLRPAA